MSKMTEKVVLITGASGGLGSQIAATLAAQGAHLALNYPDIGNQKELAQALVANLSHQHPGRYIAYPADISREEQVAAMVSKITSDLGGVDVLVNNAGISINALSWKLTEQDWNTVLGVNLNGAFYCAKAVLPLMRERRWGRIINISSVVGLRGAMGTVAYGASKAGLMGMSKTMAREVADRGITVNCIAPGYVDAGIIKDVPDKYKRENVIPAIPMGRLGGARDIAGAVLFLASEDGGYITGEVLKVDGGFAM